MADVQLRCRDAVRYCSVSLTVAEVSVALFQHQNSRPIEQACTEDPPAPLDKRCNRCWTGQLLCAGLGQWAPGQLHPVLLPQGLVLSVCCQQSAKEISQHCNLSILWVYDEVCVTCHSCCAQPWDNGLMAIPAQLLSVPLPQGVVCCQQSAKESSQHCHLSVLWVYNEALTPCV